MMQILEDLQDEVVGRLMGTTSMIGAVKNEMAQGVALVVNLETESAEDPRIMTAKAIVVMVRHLLSGCFDD